MSGRALRIGIDGSLACSKQPTGVEWFAKCLLRELLQLTGPAGGPEIRWHVYLPPYGDPGFPLPSTAVARYRPDVNTLIKNPWLVAQTWRDRLDATYAFGHLLANGCHGKTVLTVHDLAFDEYPDCYPAGAPETAHAQVAETCRRSARIVVPSEATRSGLVERYGYPADRLDVLYEGSRPAFTPGEPGPLPARVTQAGIASPFFLCVGRLDRRKNITRVIDAYRALLRDGVPVSGLVIAGPDDHGTQQVRERLEAERVEGERIVVTGYVSEDELVSLYRAAAAVVYPSLAEGFGLPVLEAMACGTPVITSNVSSLAEVGGDAALLVDPTDTAALAAEMARVLREPGLPEQLRNAGLRRAGELTWAASARRLQDALVHACAGRG